MDVQALVIFLLVLIASDIAYTCLKEKRNAVHHKYDVFLGFRGRDTRKGFTDHLYNALRAAGFAVFKDDYELYGKQIGPGIFRAIESSKIAIPIISQRYAESTWCLKELAKIMHCYSKQGLLVFPIFYEIDIIDVRHQTGEFGKAFSELTKDQKPEEVREWREALCSVTMLGAWKSQHVASGHQAKLVELVVAKVEKELWIERFGMFGKERGESTYQVLLICSPAAEKSLASALCYCLVREEIGVFNGDDQFLIGKDFAREICNAIRHCEIFIPIITKDFASSRSCLDNLAQMVEFAFPNGRTIIPIFYEVNPSQKQEVFDRFQKDMRQHKDPQGEHTYNRWYRSLNLVWSCGGWVSENIDDGKVGKLIQMVVEEVLASLKNANAWSPSTEYRLSLGKREGNNWICSRI